MSQEHLIRMFTNPFYCTSKVDEVFVVDHEPMVTEEDFVAVGVRLINEVGGEQYLRNLLANLKGEYVIED
jgi:hypothetical protein